MTPTALAVTSAPASTGTVQHDQLADDVSTSPHWSPSVSPNSVSPVSNPLDTTEEQPDPLVSALSFLTAPGKTPEPLLSMHVSASIKKRIWDG